ncbi:DMT family transporter [Magnetovibrio sp.]|uniref:DMT family transporter n=1 Tax=Magnetovibrio sp. TaxID=2024836 RepID=UPI002F9441F4
MNPGILGLVTALSWGSSDFLARLSGRAVGPARTLVVIFAISSVLLAPFAMDAITAMRADGALSMLVAATGLCVLLGTWLLYLSLTRGPLSVAVPIVSSYPVPLVVYGVAVGGFVPAPAMWAAIGATLCGVWIVSRAGHKVQHKDGHVQGRIGVTIAICIATILTFDVAIVLTDKLAAEIGLPAALWSTRTTAFAVLAAVFLMRRQSMNIGLKWWGVLSAQGAIELMGYMALFSAQTLGGTTIASVVSSAYGVVTILLARTILKEAMSLPQLMGMALVFAGVVAVTALS